MELSLERQLRIFNPEAFKSKRIDVIGVGATGSYLTWLLAKIGLQNIHIWDFDKVGEENVANQCFFLGHINQPKTEAVFSMVKKATGIEVVKHSEKVTGKKEFGEIVFLAVDTMEGRKTIWQSSLKFKMGIKLVVETRFGMDSARIYAFNPCTPSHIKGWEETLCEDYETEASLCGIKSSIAPTACLVASIAVWQLIKFFNKEEYKNELLIGFKPWAIISRNF